MSKQVITIWSGQYHDLTLTWRENNAICKLKGTHSKPWTSAAYLLQQTIKSGLQFRFTRLGWCKKDSKIKTADYRLLSIYSRKRQDVYQTSLYEFRSLPATTQKRPLTTAVSSQHTETEISGPTVVENFVVPGSPGPYRGPGPYRLQPHHQPRRWSSPARVSNSIWTDKRTCPFVRSDGVWRFSDSCFYITFV